MPLSSQAVNNVKAVLDRVTKDGATGINGLVFVAVDRKGETLVEHASGTRSVNSKEKMDMDTTFWIASMTKIVTTIAVLQLVEAQKIPLDDADFIAKHAPEIAAKLVYADGVNGVKQERGVTMRMLLAHTAGFGYSFLDPRVVMMGRPVGIDEFGGDERDIIESPMLNQPGTMWEYGIGIDWAGIILERVTGQKLNDYFQEHIFQPLGITNTTMFPTADMQKNMAYMHQRDPTTGAISERDHVYRRSCVQTTKDQQQRFFHSGGGGLWSRLPEYVKVLGMLLNDGVGQATGKRILKKETVDLMWENQIPDQPNFARKGAPTANPLLANATPEMYPQEGNPPQGWGLSMFLTIAPGMTGRGANTGWWAGLANLYWWVDRERGIAGVIGAQVVPFGDGKVVPAWVEAEKAVYDGLVQENRGRL